MRYRHFSSSAACPVLIVWLALAGGSGAALGAAEPAALPGTLPANHLLMQIDLADFQLTGKSAADATASVVDVSDAPGFSRALRAQTTHRAANEYDIQLVLPLKTVALHKGDVIWVSLWARALASSDESGQGVLGVVLEQNQEPYTKLIQPRVSVEKQWTRFAFAARVPADAAPGSLHLALRLGAAAQTLEIGDPQLVRFDDPAAVVIGDLPQTRMSYGGRGAGAAWRAAAEQRIDQLRKSQLRVRVTDSRGQPIAGATVSVRMRQHAFPFGCVYDPNLIAGPGAQSEAARTYARHFAQWFNVGVDEYAMKWPDWQKPADRALALAALDWMAAHGVKVRGHCLVWPGWNHLPADLRVLQNDPAALQRRVEQHVREEVSAFKGKLTEWDVVNEPYVNNDLMKVLGYPAMTDWFKAAHQADPLPRLLLNETSVPTNPPHDVHYDVLYEQVKAIQAEGGPIRGIGMQAHFGSSLTSIPDLQRIYDRFATLGIPIEITELDIDVNEEQLQADYLRDFLTISFAQPNISGIMMWGFVQGHHWRPDAALWRSDWQIKPAGRMWLELVKHRWWTDVTLTTDAGGAASVRGFRGDYTITASHGGHSQSADLVLSRQGASITIVLP